jgi:dihydrofolate reductase
VDITLVVAVARNGVIGRNGQLAWHLPDDLQHFKAVTMGKPILMGRRTFDSIGRALPGRRNLVLSAAMHESSAVAVGDVEWVSSLDQALLRCGDAPELCVIGGATLYALALPRATRIQLTRVHADIDGDVYFPPLNEADWRETGRSEHGADERHAYAMSFITLRRVRAAA